MEEACDPPVDLAYRDPVLAGETGEEQLLQPPDGQQQLLLARLKLWWMQWRLRRAKSGEEYSEPIVRADIPGLYFLWRPLQVLYDP